MAAKQRLIQVRVDESLHAQITKAANAMNISTAKYLRNSMEFFLEQDRLSSKIDALRAEIKADQRGIEKSISENSQRLEDLLVEVAMKIDSQE